MIWSANLIFNLENIYWVSVLCLVTQSCPTLWDPMHCSPPDSSAHGDSPDKNTGVGYHALLQGIFPTQGSNPGLDSLPSEADSLPSEPPGKPKNTGVGSLSLSRGSSRLRNRTGVSCIAGGFFTSLATREAHRNAMLWKHSDMTNLQKNKIPSEELSQLP